MRVIVVLVISYLLGSIPVGYLIVSAKTGGDVRQTGSGGTGATNVSRSIGTGGGVTTLIIDAAKGAVAVIIANILLTGVENSAWWLGVAGVVAILGHIFPIWLGFRGGKGVATGAGVFLVLMPSVLIGAAVVFVAVVLATRYVSLASMIAAATVPFIVFVQGLLSPFLGMVPMLVTALLGALVIICAHHANIRRLLSGTESKFRQQQ